MTLITRRSRLVSLRTPLATGAALLLALLAGGAGCARDAAQLELTCLDRDARFTQQFEKAYLSKPAAGNTEIVLVNDPANAAGPSANHAIQPSGVQQVMVVKVLWRPERGTKQAHSSYTNAALRWYVFDQPRRPGGPADVLEYTGAGFVDLVEVPGGTQVTIRNASLKPSATAATGALTDPVGPAKLNGTFLAKKSAKRVNEWLGHLRQAVNAGGPEQASAR